MISRTRLAAPSPATPSEPSRLAVAIPSLNEQSTVGLAVESAWLLACDGLSVTQVVVADGGSVDGTAEAAESAGARVVLSPRGRGAQLRAAIDSFREPIDAVLMLHADCHLARAAGGQLAEALSDPAIVCGAIRQRIDQPGWRYRLVERGNAFRAHRLGLPYGDQAIFARMETLRAVGGVPDTPLMEDVGLARRLRGRGKRVLLDGPLHVSGRRWERHGMFRQTLRNWALLTAFLVGVPPERIARWYRPHDGRTRGVT